MVSALKSPARGAPRSKSARGRSSGGSGKLLPAERDRDPAYAAAIESSRREIFILLLDLDRTLSPEQRARAVANLRRYAADFQLLSVKKR